MVEFFNNDIVVFLEDRRETYRSERLTFAVPKNVSKMEKTEVICISHNQMPLVASGFDSVNMFFRMRTHQTLF